MPEGPLGISPQTLRDLEYDAVPKGWMRVPPKEGMFYGYNSTNRCCKSWVLLGWPGAPNGRPKLLEENEGRLRCACPKCGSDLWFDLAHPDLKEYRKREGPPALVGGQIRTS